MNSPLLTGAAVEGRRAIRGLRRSPGFSAGVVLVLGIAIAGMVTVTTAAKSLVPAAFAVGAIGAARGVLDLFRNLGFDVSFSPPILAEMREQPMVRDLAGYYGAETVEAPNDDPWQLASVTHNLPQVLRLEPLAGRDFDASDAAPSALPVVLMSDAVWRNRYGPPAR